MSQNGTYSILPYLTYTDTEGNPLTGGYIQSYNESTGDPSPFYYDPQLTVPLSNPLYFVNIGELQQIYADPTIETYTVEYYTNLGALVQTVMISPTSNTSSNQSINSATSLVINGQFQVNYYSNDPLIPAPTTATLIAPDAFYFTKDGSDATDSVGFVSFPLDSTVPDSTPQYYLEYICTNAGTGETYKDFYYSIKNVRSLQDINVTFQVSAASLNAEVVTLLLYVEQYFGTGGSPSATNLQLIDSFNLTSTFENFFSAFTVPSLTGESIGSNGDDTLNIILRFPLNTTCDIGITNFYLQQGTNTETVTYPFETYAETAAKTRTSDLPVALPINNGDVLTYVTPGYNQDGVYELLPTVPIGTLMPYLGNSNPGNGWYLANGQTVQNNGYFSDYFSLVGYNYTLCSGFTITSASSNSLLFVCDQIGTITIPSIIYGTGAITLSSINIGSSTTHGSFVLNLNAGSTFGMGNNNSGGDYNACMWAYTPDGLAHMIIFIVNYFPFTLNNSTYFASANSVNFINIFNSYNSTEVTTATLNYLTANIPHGLATSDNLYANNATNTNVVTVFNTLSGLPLNQPTSGSTIFNLTIIQIGGSGLYQNYSYQTIDAINMDYGQYITVSTINYNLIFYFIINGDGIQPNVTANFYIPVFLNDSDVDTQVAAKLAQTMNLCLMNLPDLRGMFVRGFNSSLTNSFWIDPSQRIQQGAMNSFSFPGTLETNVIYPAITTPTTSNYGGGTSSTPIGSYYDTRPNNFSANYIIKLF